MEIRCPSFALPFQLLLHEWQHTVQFVQLLLIQVMSLYGSCKCIVEIHKWAIMIHPWWIFRRNIHCLTGNNERKKNANYWVKSRVEQLNLISALIFLNQPRWLHIQRENAFKIEAKSPLIKFTLGFNYENCFRASTHSYSIFTVITYLLLQ